MKNWRSYLTSLTVATLPWLIVVFPDTFAEYDYIFKTVVWIVLFVGGFASFVLGGAALLMAAKADDLKFDTDKIEELKVKYKELKPSRWWASVPLTLYWVVGLHQVGWTAATVVYVVMTSFMWICIMAIRGVLKEALAKQ